MSTDNELHTRIDALDAKVDYTDPNTYAQLLGYEAEAALPTDDAEQPQGDTETTEELTEAAAPAAAPAPAPAAPESSAPPAAAEPAKNDDGTVDGVATRDGKRVIPYAVLKEARESASQATARASELTQTVERLTRELEEAKAGKTPTTTSDTEVTYTPEQIAEMELDFPEQARQAKAIMALQDKLARIAQAPAASPAAAPAPAPAAQATNPADTVQEAIDNHPLLARWQSKGGAAWSEAVKVDAALQNDPEWANKPLADRFAEVQRRVADDLGIPLPAPQSTTTTAAAAPAAAPGAAQPRTTTATPTLDDLSGGPVVSSSDPLGGMSRGQMVDKAMSMSVEELHRMAGIAY